MKNYALSYISAWIVIAAVFGLGVCGLVLAWSVLMLQLPSAAFAFFMLRAVLVFSAVVTFFFLGSKEGAEFQDEVRKVFK